MRVYQNKSGRVFLIGEIKNDFLLFDFAFFASGLRPEVIIKDDSGNEVKIRIPKEVLTKHTYVVAIKNKVEIC
jgi:hypothetical protein